MKKVFSLILFVIISTAPTFSQKKVLGLPAGFERPKDVFDNPAAVKKLLLSTGEKSSKEGWVVISDRDKNPVYKEMDRGSAVVRELEFRELFYVVDEREDWLKIANAPNLNKLKSRDINTLGWIPKDRLLLWKTGLLDKRTGINKKAFLLNRADDVAKVLEDKGNYRELIVDFFRDPSAEKKEVERTIYDYFFIFKKENNMLLLGEDANLNDYNIGSKLLGWVDQRKIQEWNTRICLEPNFSTAGFAERKSNPNLRLKAFGDERNVANFVNTGESQGVFFSTDPVDVSSSFLAKGDSKRYLGNLVRYPMFKKANIDGVDFYKSGVIGNIKIFDDSNGTPTAQGGAEINEAQYALFKQKAIELAFKSKNINVFFVIEGTDKTHAFKANITQAIKSLRTNPQLSKATSINYGALIYKDIPEGDRITQFERLSPDLDKVVNFVNATDFTNQMDQDDYTAFYYGLKKSLQVAGFDDSKTNIIVMMGAAGDFSKDSARNSSAQSSNHEAWISNDEKGVILSNLANLNAHLFSFQLSNDDLHASREFIKASQRLILGGAKYIYNKNANNAGWKKVMPSDVKIIVPVMETPFGKTVVNLEGSKPGTLVLPNPDESLTFSVIERELSKMIEKSINHQNVVAEFFKINFGQGLSVGVNNLAEKNNSSAGSLSADVARAINQILEESNGEFNIPVEGLKLSLYTEVYCPVKMKDAQNNLFSFVLFMPEADLLDYQRVIARGLSTASSGAYPEKRKNLHEMYMGLIRQFSGQDVFNGKKAEDFTRAEVFQMIQGIQNEGLDLDIDLNVRIGGILNSKEVSDAEIDQLIQKFNQVNMELEKIIKLNDRFEFCMVSDNANRYYWLTMDQVF